ncbi:MAG: hypothetical protein N3F66_07930 [Spirochaetes bacterium]|nr:hypothetical protein [Spirochaetota bacterium]
MIEKLHSELQQSLLSLKELQHLLFLLQCGDSNRQPVPDELINEGYIIADNNRFILTNKGKVYKDSLLQKLACFYAASQQVFGQYFDKELSPLKKELQTVKTQWRHARDTKLKYKKALLKQGKDTAAVKKDALYRKLEKEQNALCTRMRHVEKQYNKKLSECITKLGIVHK